MDNKILFFSTQTQVSESKNYLDLVDRVCYYDAPNLNGVQLPSENAAQYAETLVNMPIVAKCTFTKDGKSTFKGHEYYKDVDGDWAADTSPIGTHVSVEIKPDHVMINGEDKVLPCLFAKQRIWKRNKNVVAAVKRLFSEGRLFNSWELISNKYEFDDGIKILKEYEFIGNAFLGEDNPPAYPGAQVLSVSSMNEARMLVAEAMIQDKICKGGDNKMNDEQNGTVISEATEETQEQVVESTGTENSEISAVEDTSQTIEEAAKSENSATTAEPEVTEVAQLTMNDIRRQIWDQLDRMRANLMFVFPEEREIWAHPYDEPEISLMRIFYQIDGDKVILSEPEKVELRVDIRHLNEQFENLNVTIQKLNETVMESQKSIDELTQVKDKYDALIAEQNRQKHEADVSALRDTARRSGKFTEKELSSDEMVELFEKLDVSAINQKIVDRVIVSTVKANHESEPVPTYKVDLENPVVDYTKQMEEFLSK